MTDTPLWYQKEHLYLQQSRNRYAKDFLILWFLEKEAEDEDY